MRKRLRAFGIPLVAVAAVLSCAAAASAVEAFSTGPAPPAFPAPGREASRESLAGSTVAFSPDAGGEACYDATATYCFEAVSNTSDWEYAYTLWLRFPTGSTVNDVSVQGAPSCSIGSSFGTFDWATEGGANIARIDHPRYHADIGTCTAVYCVAVSLAGTASPSVSWYWDGDAYGGAPHNPCSSDGFTPAGQPACDDSTGALVSIPPRCVVVTPGATQLSGCATPKTVALTLANNTASGAAFTLDYGVSSGVGVITGPPSVWADAGATATFDATIIPGLFFSGSLSTVVTATGNGSDSEPAEVAMDVLVGSQWGAVAAEPDSGRRDNVLASWNGLIWSVTGYGLTADVRTYNPATDAWATVGTPPPFGINYARSGCVAGSKVYLYGDTYTPGFAGLWSYDMASGAWTNETPAGTAPALTGIWAPAWVRDQETGRCYLTGGASTPGTGDQTTVYVYDPGANAWVDPLPSFGTARDFHAAYIFRRPADAHKLLCIAGGNSSDVGLSSTQCYDFTTAAWNAENADLGALGGTLWGMGYGQTDNDGRLWLVAGVLNDSAPTKTTSYYDTGLGTWVDGGDLPGAGVYRNAATVHDGLVYKLGGTASGMTPQGETARQFECYEAADLAVALAAGDPAPARGQAVIFTLTASNNGPNDQSRVTVVQRLPAGLNYVENGCGATFSGGAVAWSVGDLAWGATATCTVTATADAWGTLETTATISGGGADPIPGNNSAAATLTVDVAPLLIFQDLFTDGNPGGDAHWMETRGDWSVNRVRNYASNRLYENLSVVASLDGVRAGRIVAKLDLTNSFVRYPNAAIVFAWQDNAHYRFARIRSGRLEVGQVGALGGQPGGLKATKLYAFKVNRWYPMRVDFYEDGTVKVYRGAALMATYKFAAAVPGKVGLLASKAVSLFDAFQLFDPAVLP